MSALLRLTRNLWYTVWYTFAIAVVISAVTLNLARLLLPVADEYREKIAARMSSVLGHPVQIGGLDAEWHGIGLRLVLNNVRLINEQDDNLIIRSAKVRLGFDFISYIRFGRFGLSDISLSGVNLFLERHIDGSISLAGMKQSDKNTTIDHTLESLLFDQLNIEVQNTNIYWDDVDDGGNKLHFTNVNINLRNDNDRHQLDGSLLLPDNLGQKIEFALDIKGNPLVPKQWQGQLYMSGKSVNISNILHRLGRNNSQLVAGMINFKFWSHFSNEHITRLTSRFDAKDILVENISAKKTNTVSISHFKGNTLWQRKQSGWELYVDEFTLENDQGSWPKTRMHLTSSAMALNKPSSFESKISYLNVDDFVKIILANPYLDTKSRNFLLQIKPKGIIENLYLAYNVKNTGKNRINFYLEAELEKLQFQAWERYPGVSNLSGFIRSDETAGIFRINSQQMQVHMPHVFRDRIAVDKMFGELNWLFNKDEWRISSNNLVINNKDIETQSYVDITKLSEGGSPHLNLVVNFKEGNASRISHYLPAHIMSDRVVNWIDKSILAGNVPSGGVIVHGNVKDFPFHKDEGKFEVLFDVKEGQLDYSPGWPSISNIDAHLVFRGKGLAVYGESAEILKSAISNTQIVIADIARHPPLLEITGQVKGSSKDKLDFLRQAPPLSQRYESILDYVTVSGNSVLNLNLKLPLGKQKNQGTVALSGHVHLEDNTINLDGRLGRIWDNLGGTLLFTEQSLAATNMQGNFFQRPANMTIETRVDREDKNKHSIVYKVNGRFSPSILLKRYFPALAKYVKGDTDWTVEYVIPMDSKHEIDQSTVHVETSLFGCDIALPMPFTKENKETVHVSLNARLKPTEQLYQIQYGDELNSILRFNSINKKFEFDRGQMEFGSKKAVLPTEAGLAVTGHIDKFIFEDWVNIFTPDVAPKIQKSNHWQKKLDVAWLKNIGMHANHIDIFGHTFEKIQIDAKNNDDDRNWKLAANSKTFTGDIVIPYGATSEPIVLDLDHWYFSPVEKGGNDLDPRNLPAMKIVSKQFSYGEFDLGRIQISTSRMLDGARFDEINFESKHTKVSGKGEWRFDGAQNFSKFNIRLESKNVGKTMQDFGYAGTIAGGHGTVDIDLQWNSVPYDISPSFMKGNIGFTMKDGQLLDVDMGAGRILGLLSIQALPRRLALDFSDLFSKGFTFDELKGEFRIEEGDAYTNNLTLNGPVARLLVAGRVGLVDQDYDQLVTVIPDITASVPALTVLMVNPVTGVVTWVLKNIFQSQIDEVVSHQYLITGYWKNPKIEAVIKKTQTEDLDD